MTHNFGEKKTENYKGNECPVWQTPKYENSKKKAIEIIESGLYDLTDGDFWILMNTYAGGTKMMYTGLIISHNGCLKINDKLEDPFKAEFLKREWLNGTLIYEYNDNTLYEVGEVSEKNCRNDYPYAMAYKRCFDRVVLKKCKLAFNGIYSDSEAEEFKKNDERTITESEFKLLTGEYTSEEINAMMGELKVKKGSEIPYDYFVQKMKAKYPDEEYY